MTRAVAILETVARFRDGISLAELSKNIGLHSSTTFHLAKTLVTVGFLRQDPESRRYRVGSRFFGLASGALDEIEILDIARPFLTALAEETGETSHIAVRSGNEVVIIGKVDGAASVRISERIGSARPAYATAIGKVLLSALPETELGAYLATILLKPITRKTIVDPDMLRAEIDNVRLSGIAFDDGELDPEVRCLAAPVRNFTGHIIAAIGISGPVWRLNLIKMNQATEAVRRAAVEMSHQIGYQDDMRAPGRDA